MREAKELLAEWEPSGERMSDWCRARGINWRSLVAYRDTRPGGEVEFVEVEAPASGPGGLYRIVLGGGVAVEVDDRFQEATLGRLLRVLSPC